MSRFLHPIIQSKYKYKLRCFLDIWQALCPEAFAAFVKIYSHGSHGAYTIGISPDHPQHSVRDIVDRFVM